MHPVLYRHTYWENMQKTPNFELCRVLSLTSWLEFGPDAIRASKWSLWIRAHMETVSVGACAGGGAPHNGWMKPLNCSATSISVVGLRMMLVLRRMDTWRRGDEDGGWMEAETHQQRHYSLHTALQV